MRSFNFRKQRVILQFVFSYILSILVLVMLCSPPLVEAEAPSSRTKADIVEEWNKENQLFEYKGLVYKTEPQLKAPFKSGELTQGFLNDGLNSLNFVRYLVGLPNDVELDEQLVKQAQHGAALLASINELTHQPQKPSMMDNDFYELAYASTSSSNIAMGYSSISESILKGYMEDGDISNIDRLGHRRWVLNPNLKKTGFGYVGKYSTTQVFDNSRDKEVALNFIAFPSNGYFPLEYFTGAGNQYPWSLTLNPEKYSEPSMEDVKVTLTRKRDNKTWTFSKSTIAKNNTYFNIDTSGYGIGNCIIFRPDITELKDGDSFNVTITGIRDINSNSTTLSYDTTFFKVMKDVEIGFGDYKNKKQIPYKIQVITGANSKIDITNQVSLEYDLYDKNDNELIYKSTNSGYIDISKMKQPFKIHAQIDIKDFEVEKELVLKPPVPKSAFFTANYFDSRGIYHESLYIIQNVGTDAGVKITWSSNKKSVTLKKGKTTIKLNVGQNTAYLNGKPLKLEYKVQFKNGTIEAPSRVISKKLKLKLTNLMEYDTYLRIKNEAKKD